jgi:hypothetical protein
MHIVYQSTLCIRTYIIFRGDKGKEVTWPSSSNSCYWMHEILAFYLHDAM